MNTLKNYWTNSHVEFCKTILTVLPRIKYSKRSLSINPDPQFTLLTKFYNFSNTIFARNVLLISSVKALLT